jgi:hypothetical protein
LTWPPEDPTRQRDTSRKQRARQAASRDEAVFTSGSLLNPIKAQAGGALRQRGPQPRPSTVSPYHDDYDEASGPEQQDDDDRPLGTLPLARTSSLGARRGAGALQLSHDDGEPQPGIRVRRGSEGYEVRPLAQPTGWDMDEMEGEEDVYGDEGVWTGGVTSVREGLVDQDGDPIREGPRYNVYEPEEGSEDEGWSGSEESWE